MECTDFNEDTYGNFNFNTPPLHANETTATGGMFKNMSDKLRQQRFARTALKVDVRSKMADSNTPVREEISLVKPVCKQW